MTSLEDQARAELESASAQAGEGRLRVVPMTDLLTAPAPAPRYVVQDLIPRGSSTMLGGHGGAGKSLLALIIGAHIAAGALTWAGHHIEDGRVMFVSLEDPASVVRHRLKKIVQHFGLDAEKIARRLTVADGTEGDSALAYESAEFGARRLQMTAAYEELCELARGHCLIVLDNASDAFSANENDRRQVRAFMRALAQIARDNDAGVLLLAHIDKHAARNGASGNTFSGSTAWHNSARSRLALTKNQIGTIELIHEKANFGKVADPMAFAWSEDGLLLPVVRAVPNAAAAQAAKAAELAQADADVLDAVQRATTAGVTVSASVAGAGNTLICLRGYLPDAYTKGDGRKAFWSAVARLRESGQLSRVEYTDAYRHTKEKLVCGNAAVAAIPPTPPLELPHEVPQSQSCASSAVIPELPQNCRTAATDETEAEKRERILSRFRDKGASHEAA